MSDLYDLQIKHKNLINSHKNVLWLLQKSIEFNDATKKEYENHLKYFTEIYLTDVSVEVTKSDNKVKTEPHEKKLEKFEVQNLPVSSLNNGEKIDGMTKVEEKVAENFECLKSSQVKEIAPLTKSQKARAKKLAAKKLKQKDEKITVSDSAEVKRKLDEIIISSDDINKKNKKSTVDSFRRVKDEDVDLQLLAKMGKNSFDHKKGAQGSFGEKAYLDLKKTRGKSFVAEKNKKKKGNYRGGKIDSVNSFSVKYDSD